MSGLTYISFDIDGTMIAKGQAITEHHQAFVHAVSTLFGPCDIPRVFLGHPVNGWMDQAILAEMIEKCGAQATPENLQKAVLETEDAYLRTARTTPEVLPGVEHLLQTLSELPNVVIGIASGNLPRLCWKKLELAGIAKYFPDRVGGYGTSASRADAILRGKDEAGRLFGKKVKRVIHFGDTPDDIEAAHAAGAKAIAVLTGFSTTEELSAAELVVKDLTTGFDSVLAFVKKEIEGASA